MAAGQGFKTFTTGEVLTAGDVNGYLMQGINVFADATARDAAITAPAEGQFAFTKDNNSLWYYDGAAWVASGATGDIEGVTAGVGISGGGTSGTVTVTNSMATAIDAKGDLVPGTGADTFARLAVGANGTVLTADSTEATGLKWATSASGGMTLIATATPSSATTVSFTSIPSTYTNLLIVWVGETSGGTTPYFSIRCNNDTTSALHPWTAAGFTAGNNLTTYGSSNGTSWGDSYRTAPIGATNSLKKNGVVWFYDYTSTGSKVGTWMSQADSGNPTLIQGVGAYNGASAISQIDFIRNDTQTITGTFKLYGVK